MRDRRTLSGQENAASKPREGLLLLVTVLAQTLLPLVSGNLMTLSLFTAGHELMG